MTVNNIKKVSEKVGFLLVISALLLTSLNYATKYHRTNRLYQATLSAYGRDLAYLECLDHSRPCSEIELLSLKAENEKALNKITEGK